MNKKNTVETEVTEEVSLDIPESWASPRWTEIIDIQGGGQPPKSEFIEEPRAGYIRLLQIRDFESDDKAVYIPEQRAPKTCNADDILIGRYGASVGRICTGKAGAYNVALVKCLFDRNRIAPPYFKFFLKSGNFQRFIVSFERAAQGGFNKDDLASFPVPLPPLPEQRRIVAKIEATTAKIEIIEKAADEAEKLLQKYRESILAKAFRGELVPQDPSEGTGHDLIARIRSESNEATTSKKKKSSSPQESEDAVSLDIPESWAYGRASELLDYTSGSHIPPTDYSMNPDDGLPFLTGPSDFRQNTVHVTKYSRLARAHCLPNDVLVTVKGSGTGTSVLSDIKAGISRQLTAFRGKKVGIFDSVFLLLVFKTIQVELERAAKGIAIPGISLPDVLDRNLVLPPLVEQKRIVAAIEKHESIAEVLQTNINNLKAQAKKLRESILASAFSGKLVPQDPSEGTGHELLEQIRAATATAPDSEDVTAEAPKKPRKKRVKK